MSTKLKTRPHVVRDSLRLTLRRVRDRVVRRCVEALAPSPPDFPATRLCATCGEMLESITAEQSDCPHCALHLATALDDEAPFDSELKPMERW